MTAADGGRQGAGPDRVFSPCEATEEAGVLQSQWTGEKRHSMYKEQIK